MSELAYPTDSAAPLPVEVHSGNLEVRLAASEAEIAAAQALRYRVFVEEMGARPSAEMVRLRRDFDAFDTACDHLLVLDHARRAVVGTYRLMRRAMAARAGGFYTAGEFDLAPVLTQPGELLELGRSCVDVAARNRPTVQLLWHGLAAYVFHHRIRLMFGCASLHGADAAAHALPLAYLAHHHLAPPELRVRALPGARVEMRRVAAEAIDEARARAALPPLLKGYLRLGGWVGDGAVLDREFNTTDVCVIVETAQVTEKYYRHYERQAREGAAP